MGGWTTIQGVRVLGKTGYELYVRIQPDEAAYADLYIPYHRIDDSRGGDVLGRNSPVGHVGTLVVDRRWAVDAGLE